MNNRKGELRKDGNGGGGEGSRTALMTAFLFVSLNLMRGTKKNEAEGRIERAAYKSGLF